MVGTTVYVPWSILKGRKTIDFHGVFLTRDSAEGAFWGRIKDNVSDYGIFECEVEN